MYLSRSQSELPLHGSLGIDEVSEAFDLREVQTTGFEGPSGELASFGRATAWNARQAGVDGVYDGSSRMDV